MAGNMTKKKGVCGRVVSTIRSFNFSQLSATMPIEEERTDANLARKLTFVDLYAYGISLTIGVGIYLSIGEAAEKTGPSFIISYLIAAFASLLSALCYGEFAVRLPLSGSAYSYSQVTLGEFFAWNIGWILTLEYGVCSAVVARGINDSIAMSLSTFGVNVPPFVTGYQFWESGTISFAPIPIFLILLCAIPMFKDVKLSLQFTVVTTVINLVILLFIIVLGLTKFKADHWVPFTTSSTSGVFSASVTAFFSYIGFDGVATLAGEAKHPKKDLHRAILYTLLTVTVLYLAVSVSYIGITPADRMKIKASIVDGFGYVGMRWASTFLTIITCFIMIIVTYSTILAQPRIFYQMAKDGLFFQSMARLNKQKIPVNSVILTIVSACIIGGFFDLKGIIDFVSIGTFFSFAAVGCAVIIVRIKVKPTEKNKVSYSVHPRFESLARYAYPKLALIIFSYFIFVALFSFVFALGDYISPLWSILPIIFVIITVFLICIFKSHNIPTDFACPLFPVVPLLQIFVNVYLLSQELLSMSMLFFVIYLVVGLQIYIFYGHWHSVLRAKKETQSDVPELNTVEI